MPNKIRRVIDRLTKKNAELIKQIDKVYIDNGEAHHEIGLLKETNKNLLRDLLTMESTAKAQSGMLMIIFMYWFLKQFF